MFVPNESNCPIPLKYVDVMRVTQTNLDSPSESRIEDIWWPTPGDIYEVQRDLSSPWTGKTTFDLIRPVPPKGYEWVEGRLTKIQSTERPPNVTPETWLSVSRKAKKKAKAQWENIGPKRQDARVSRSILPHVMVDEYDEYNRIMMEARER